MWDIGSGREVQTRWNPGTVMAAMGVVFIGFASDNRLVTVGDSVRVWDVTTGQELRTIEGSVLSTGSFNGTDSGMTLTPDGKQLLFINDAEVKFIDLTSGKEVNRVKLPDDQINSLQLSVSADGHVLAAGVVNKHFKFWDLTAKTSKELATTSKDFCQVTISRDGRLLGLSENYTLRTWETQTLRELPVLKIPHGGSFGLSPMRLLPSAKTARRSQPVALTQRQSSGRQRQQNSCRS
jgi:WD40 repeat protein